MQVTGEITSGSIGIMVSILGSALALYLKSRLDLQRLTIGYVELKADITEIKADLKLSQQNQQDVKLELAKISATQNQQSALAGLPSQLEAAMTRFIEAGRVRP